MESRYHPEEAKRFTADTAEHQMKVLHEDGLYRHIRFQAPGTMSYYFDLITWPGNLMIRGDMGDFAFARIEDMLGFFRSGTDINPQYWEEKVTAGRGDTKRYSEEKFKKLVLDHVKEHTDDLAADELEEIEDHYLPGDVPAEPKPSVRAQAFLDAVRREVLEDDYVAGEDGAHQALTEFKHDGWEFYDTWEWDLKDWTFQYLWCCFAIRWGADQYVASKADHPLPSDAPAEQKVAVLG